VNPEAMEQKRWRWARLLVWAAILAATVFFWAGAGMLLAIWWR
jgi:hypothetical protein